MDEALTQLAELSVSKVVRGYGNTFFLEFGEVSATSGEELTLSITGIWRLNEGDRVLASSEHSDWQSIDLALEELVGKKCQRKLSGNTACFVFKPGEYVLEVLSPSSPNKGEAIWSLSRKRGFSFVGEDGNGLVVGDWNR